MLTDNRLSCRCCISEAGAQFNLVRSNKRAWWTQLKVVFFGEGGMYFTSQTIFFYFFFKKRDSRHVGSRVAASTDGAEILFFIFIFGFCPFNSIDFYIGVVVCSCTCTEFQNWTRPWLRFPRTEVVFQIACEKIFVRNTITCCSSYNINSFFQLNGQCTTANFWC